MPRQRDQGVFEGIDALLEGSGSQRRQNRQQKKQNVDEGDSVCPMIHKNKRGIIIDPPLLRFRNNSKLFLRLSGVDGTDYFLPSTRSFNSFPTLKKGNFLDATLMFLPVFGFLPV